MRWEIKKYILKRDGLEQRQAFIGCLSTHRPALHSSVFSFDCSFFVYWPSNCSAMVVARTGNSADGLSI